MLIRALIVLLFVLNLGVAAWWITRPAPEPPLPPELPAGVARLQLVDEPQANAAPPPAANTPSSAVTAAPAEPQACFSLGPFADAAAANTVLEKLRPQILRSKLREVPGVSASGYRIVLPPAATREEAQANAQRIGAAGFNDFLIINSGDEINSIALGRYRNRESAERRLSALQAAGFPAQMLPAGRAPPSKWWLDVGATAAADPAGWAAQTGGATPQSLDCTALR
ncbi:SPOR domain-containing protein [Pseudoxanthomonas sp. UTMC 1351]|uniref:SPOR domain-containing protein n=1 Tax=Pseudoxanthomonas sp. UTMC 1351 TaxID=2695853 RepID=UPI0034CEB4E0